MDNSAQPPDDPHQSLGLGRNAVSGGLSAARRNLGPGVVLWVFGAAIIFGYFWVPAVRNILDRVGEWKTNGGLWFSIVSTSIFGGAIPTLIDGVKRWNRQRDLLFLLTTNMILWGLKGIEIDLLYRAQSFVFGDQLHWGTIAAKTFFDQLIYVPAFGLVNVILFVYWRDSGFSWAVTRRKLGSDWYRQHVLPVLISNWFVWIPAVMLIYCLPPSLQLPIQNLVLVFWILILTFLTSHDPNR